MNHLPYPDPSGGDNYTTVYVGKHLVTMTRNETSYYFKMDLESQSQVGKAHPMLGFEIDMMTGICCRVQLSERYQSPPEAWLVARLKERGVKLKVDQRLRRHEIWMYTLRKPDVDDGSGSESTPPGTFSAQVKVQFPYKMTRYEQKEPLDFWATLGSIGKSDHIDHIDQYAQYDQSDQPDHIDHIDHSAHIHHSAHIDHSPTLPTLPTYTTLPT